MPYLCNVERKVFALYSACAFFEMLKQYRTLVIVCFHFLVEFCFFDIKH